MGPSKASSSKGKNADNSQKSSDWSWHERGGYYTRTNDYGETEKWVPPSSQQEDTPRSSHDNALTSGIAPDVDNSYSANLEPQDNYSHSAGGRDYPASSSNSDNYTVASPIQSTSSRGTAVAYSPQLTSSLTKSSTANYSSAYAPTSGSTQYQYASQSSNYGNRSYQTSQYDDTGGVASAFNDISLGSSSAVPEQDHSDSSQNIIRNPVNTADREQLDPRYRVVSEKDQRKFWRVGRVFMMLWTEPAKTMGGTRNGTHYSTVWLEQGVYSEIRRFVVMREGYGNSICSPIHTYNGQATLKANLPERHQHTIIYTSDLPPPEYSYVANDDTIVRENLTKDPIKVKREQEGPEGDLGAFSRLNYSKIYTIENYVRVLKIGMVEKDWLPSLNANSYVRTPSQPIQKPTSHKPEKGSKSSSSSGHKKGKESSRRPRR